MIESESCAHSVAKMEDESNICGLSKRQLNKAKRKEMKAKSLLLKQQNIQVSDHPTTVSEFVT